MQTVRQAVRDKSYKHNDFRADDWDQVKVIKPRGRRLGSGKAIKPRDAETVFRRQRTDKHRQPHIARL